MPEVPTRADSYGPPHDRPVQPPSAKYSGDEGPVEERGEHVAIDDVNDALTLAQGLHVLRDEWVTKKGVLAKLAKSWRMPTPRQVRVHWEGKTQWSRKFSSNKLTSVLSLASKAQIESEIAQSSGSITNKV